VVTLKIDFELITLSDFMVERILSGRLCPLTAPVGFRSAPLRFPLRSRSAHMLYY